MLQAKHVSPDRIDPTFRSTSFYQLISPAASSPFSQASTPDDPTMAIYRRKSQLVNIIVVLVCALFLLALYRGRLFPASSSRSSSHRAPKRPAAPPPPPAEPPNEYDIELVVASTTKDNVTWLDDYLLDWKKSIYVVDDPLSPLTVEVNKGREANVFLTYIIDRYDTLPGNIIFHHAERFQWHNDNPDYDALPLLQRLNFEHLWHEGYANLRCVWVLGCPNEIRPVRDEGTAKEGAPIHAKHVYRGAFEELFPELPVPETVGVTCCSQFAVRRETIWRRPKSDYVRFREWLVNSPLKDDLSGRVLEYSWHSKLPPPQFPHLLNFASTSNEN